MDGKYCIKRTKMNKMTHFAYNLGIWLGLLRVSYGFNSRRECQKRDRVVSFFGTPDGNSVPARFIAQGAQVFGKAENLTRRIQFLTSIKP